MTITFYLILAMAGAALLGFAVAWFWQNHSVSLLQEERNDLASELTESQAVNNRLLAESETQKLSIENMQRLMQSLESQCFGYEQSAKLAQSESEMYREEKLRLMSELDIQMRENEAIREMPEIELDVEVGEEEEGELDLRTKAKKLVSAFKKGFQTEGPPPSAS